MSLFSFSKPAVPRAIVYNRWLPVGVVLWTIFTVVVLGIGGWMTWHNHLFADHARKATGTVLRHYTTITHGKGGSTTTHYHLNYGYRVGDLLVNASTSVRQATWSQLGDGGPVPIKYLPEKPQDSRVDNAGEDYDAWQEATIGLVVGLSSLVIGSIVTARAYRRNRQQKRLVAQGIPTQGRITSVDTERVGKQMMLFLLFEFNDNRGQLVEARTRPLTSKEEGVWTIGKAVPVFYDRDNSRILTVDLSHPSRP